MPLLPDFFFYSFLLLFTSFVDLSGMYRSIVWMPCGETAYYPQQVAKDTVRVKAALLNYWKYSCNLQREGALGNNPYVAFSTCFLWLYLAEDLEI